MFVYIWSTPATPEPALGAETDHESRQMTRTLGRRATAVARFVPPDQNAGARTEDPADAAPAQERGAVDSDAAAQGGDGSRTARVGLDARRPSLNGRPPTSMKRSNIL